MRSAGRGARSAPQVQGRPSLWALRMEICKATGIEARDQLLAVAQPSSLLQHRTSTSAATERLLPRPSDPKKQAARPLPASAATQEEGEVSAESQSDSFGSDSGIRMEGKGQQRTLLSLGIGHSCLLELRNTAMEFDVNKLARSECVAAPCREIAAVHKLACKGQNDQKHGGTRAGSTASAGFVDSCGSLVFGASTRQGAEGERAHVQLRLKQE